jgi:Mrp family chromosome partitioning ATPase
LIIQRAIEKAKQRLKPEEAARHVVPGVVPAGERPAVPVTDMVKAGTQYADFAGLRQVVLDPDESERNRILLAEGTQGDLAHAEPAYRLLRSRIRQRMVAGNWSCIGITSPGPGEGKTVTALNLALSLAREKQRPIFLVDLDMRNPSVFKYVGATPAVQISDFLRSAAQPDEVLFSTSVDCLAIAGNRAPVEGASELLATRGLEMLLMHIRVRFPGAIIIIDLPPVTSTDEALLVAPHVDAMYLVIGEGITRRDALTRAQNLLSDFVVAGMILNRSVERQDSYYYGRY